MKYVLSLIALGLCVSAQAQTTLAIPPQSCTAVITCQGVNVTVPGTGTGGSGGGTGSGGGGGTTTPPGKTTWMYLNGVKTLAGDFTAQGETTNYAHATSAGYNGGTKDILITSSVPWGYFLPYWAANYQLPNPGWTTLIFAIKPSLATSTFSMHAERVGDNPLATIALAGYCGAFAAGKWTSCTVPLSALGVAGDKTLYKVLFQTSTAGPDSWEMDAIGFQ
jgi:hypothetical protein